MRHLGCGVYVLVVGDGGGLLITEWRADVCVHAHLAAGLRGGPSHVCRAQSVLLSTGPLCGSTSTVRCGIVHALRGCNMHHRAAGCEPFSGAQTNAIQHSEHATSMQDAHCTSTARGLVTCGGRHVVASQVRWGGCYRCSSPAEAGYLVQRWLATGRWCVGAWSGHAVMGLTSIGWAWETGANLHRVTTFGYIGRSTHFGRFDPIFSRHLKSLYCW